MGSEPVQRPVTGFAGDGDPQPPAGRAVYRTLMMLVWLVPQGVGAHPLGLGFSSVAIVHHDGRVACYQHRTQNRGLLDKRLATDYVYTQR
jgi:hypothetical protein